MESKSNIEQVLLDDKTYNVISYIKGGMGKVWLLEQADKNYFDPIYQPKIAVKTFDFMKDEKAIETELNIWISLEHSSILPLKKIGRLNYRLAAIMPLLDGNLFNILEQKGPFNELETSLMILEIVYGLYYAWSNFKILHLDLKPSNILIKNKPTFQLKITDWGISRLVNENRYESGVKVQPDHSIMNDQVISYVAGTPLFMAPERFSGQWTLSPSADIYSLGMIAIQLNTGVLPFRFGQNDPIMEICSGSYYENAYEILEDRNLLFKNFCLKCIHPNPAIRIDNLNDVINELKSIIKKKK